MQAQVTESRCICKTDLIKTKVHGCKPGKAHWGNLLKAKCGTYDWDITSAHHFSLGDLPSVSYPCSYHFLLVNNVLQPLEILPFESRQNKQGILLILLHFLDCTFRICDPESCFATHIFFKPLHWSRVQPGGKQRRCCHRSPSHTTHIDDAHSCHGSCCSLL